MNTAKQLGASAAVCAVLGVAAVQWANTSVAQAPAAVMPSLGAVEWNVAERPTLKFEPKSGFGVYAKTGDSVQLMFYAEALPADVLSYAAKRSAAILNGKFMGFKANAEMDKQIQAAAAQSISLWSKLSDVMDAPVGKRPATVTAKDLRGIGLCVARNCGHYSGGFQMKDAGVKVAALSFPLSMPAGAERMEAYVDLAVNKADTGLPPKRVELKGKVPFEIVED